MSCPAVTRRTLLERALGAGVALVISATPLLAQDAMSTMDHSGMAMDSAPAEGISGSNAMEMAHEHLPQEVSPELPVPSVTHLVFPDAMDGYNVQILAKNFTFTPAAINRDVVFNEGHAHLYVNGNKVARVYDSWHHLPSSLLRNGVNLVTVTLNANDHGEWSIGADPIASTVRVIKP